MTNQTRLLLPRLFTINEIAKHLNVSSRSVRRWIDAGELEVYRLGRNIRISEATLRGFLESKRQR